MNIKSIFALLPLAIAAVPAVALPQLNDNAVGQSPMMESSLMAKRCWDWSPWPTCSGYGSGCAFPSCCCEGFYCAVEPISHPPYDRQICRTMP
ncbi:hypothetical protein D9619_004295 [Psilocybe cf. subviscida]|uniref:Uncharacterized protein n=1 Tax=Psilocybe cf. subviscida TaxID=2480587 RepID=A0A8H5F7S4_9AGAR|nr:hypothetical protein D9619_004295 [Psilocybe cf. subviscida]